MTGRIIPLPPDRHRQVQALLPWYVAGQLDAEDEARVGAHIASCPECQAELAGEGAFAAALNEAAPDPAIDTDQGWAAMQRRIADESRSSTPLNSAKAATGAMLAGWRSSEPWMRWALVAQSCLLLFALGAVWQTSQPAPYRALGAEPVSDTANIVVVFRPQTTEQNLRSILRASDARLVGGPTTADAYLLQAPPAERAAALAKLRAQADVVLAEPVDAGSPVP